MQLNGSVHLDNRPTPRDTRNRRQNRKQHHRSNTWKSRLNIQKQNANTAGKPMKNTITDNNTAATNAENTQDKKNEESTTADTTTKTGKQYSTNGKAPAP